MPAPGANAAQSVDVFTAAVGSGGLFFDWSTAANWSAGSPIDGGAVIDEADSADDLAALDLAQLTDTTAQISVLGTLTLGLAVLGAGARLVTAGAGVLTVAAYGGTPGILEATAASRVVSRAASDPGEHYLADGGTVEVFGALADTSSLEFYGGEIALAAPGAAIAAQLSGIDAGDTLELPGSVLTGFSAGAGTLTVTTDRGIFAFGNVLVASPLTGVTAAPDAATGLLALTFDAPDVFARNAAAASGPFAGQRLWSDAASWSQGVPTTGNGVAMATSAVDDLPGLSLQSVTLSGNAVLSTYDDLRVGTLDLGGDTSGVSTMGGLLDVGSVVAGAGHALLAMGAAANAFVLVGGTGGTGGLYGASGAGAAFADLAADDPGETYLAQSGGTVKLAAAPSDDSTLRFDGAGTFELFGPATTVAAAVTGIVAGDRLELPGTAVTQVALGAGSLSVTTDLGTTSFGRLAFAGRVTGVSVGADPASGLATLTFTDQARAADFNGDGTSDQLWQAVGGALVDYAMNGGTIAGGAIVGSLDPSYTFLAAGDFHGDGTADQLWQAATGAVVDYAMQNGTISSAAIVGAADPGSRFLAAADFNGDGTTDLLWQAANGAIVVDTMQAGTIAASSTVGRLDASWRFLAAADCNGDGTADQLWQAADGEVVDFAVTDATITAGTSVGSFGPTMRFLAAADFNGDGRADMLWQDTATGAIVDDTMDGATIVSSVTVGALDATWKFLAAGDFDGDGTADQLWQAAGGGIVDFTMRDGTIASGAEVGALDGTFRFLA